ncbi:MAG: alpha/beta hydrolase [Verrucomicrobiota bacterium]|nr:alpha/beta hydrolase [Verrucomicrobiota bacterium]
MRDLTHLVPLPGGARVAVQEYGAPDGQPVFFFHGWPSSRRMAALADGPARELGLRILSPDRPGIGRSSWQQDRNLAHWPPLLQALAEHFEAPRFRIMAISGGAPYAYVAGWALPEQVEALAVVCGVPPLGDPEVETHLMPLYRWLLGLYRRRPGGLRWAFRTMRWAGRLRPPPWIRKTLPVPDRETLDDPAAFEICFGSYSEAWAGATDGVFADASIYAAPWGFSLEAVHVPVHLWHGTEDRNFSPRVAERIAQRLPNCRFRLVEGEGHYSLPIRRVREILEDLAAAPARATKGTPSRIEL